MLNSVSLVATTTCTAAVLYRFAGQGLLIFFCVLFSERERVASIGRQAPPSMDWRSSGWSKLERRHSGWGGVRPGREVGGVESWPEMAEPRQQ